MLASCADMLVCSCCFKTSAVLLLSGFYGGPEKKNTTKYVFPSKNFMNFYGQKDRKERKRSEEKIYKSFFLEKYVKAILIKNSFSLSVCHGFVSGRSRREKQQLWKSYDVNERRAHHITLFPRSLSPPSSELKKEILQLFSVEHSVDLFIIFNPKKKELTENGKKNTTYHDFLVFGACRLNGKSLICLWHVFLFPWPDILLSGAFLCLCCLLCAVRGTAYLHSSPRLCVFCFKTQKVFFSLRCLFSILGKLF